MGEACPEHVEWADRTHQFCLNNLTLVQACSLNRNILVQSRTIEPAKVDRRTNGNYSAKNILYFI